MRKTPIPVFITKQELVSGPQTILVPTDFSDCAKQAAEQALMLVRQFGGEVLFLHVVDLYTPYPPIPGAPPLTTPPLTPEALEPEWQNFLRDLPFDDGLSWGKLAREGRAAQTIVDVAKAKKANLIVMGTHGRSGIPHILLGSVAEKVGRIAECSVMTVRPKAFRLQLP